MLTRPPDVADQDICAALRAGWSFAAGSAEYRPEGFGSHHWAVTAAGGARLFATVDDLTARGDPEDAAFGRLAAAFGTARALRDEAGLAFVVAPAPAADGRLLVRLRAGYSLVVHPYLAGHPAGQDGVFDRKDDQDAVVGMLAELHRAAARAPADDFTGPGLDGLRLLLDQAGQPWDAGPYAERARGLMAAHGRDLEVLIGAYRDLGARAAGQPERMVITHGEPHPGNVMITPDGPMLIDWDTVLLAPPERDLWGLAEHDPSVPGRYAAAAGTPVDPGAMALYRLSFDLDEIGYYLRLFRVPHAESADTAQAWRSLRHHLQPAARWPALLGGRRA